ncbi:MAG: P27 family phage terminase small subunit [Pseudomonadota bacterium]
MRQPRYGDIFAGHDEGASMAEQAKVLWAEYKSDLEGRGLWNATRGRTVDRLVRIKAEYLHYHPIAVSEGPVMKGPNGGDVANMLWSQVRNMADQIAKLEKALTLTPESLGEKKSPGLGGAPKSEADEFLGAH